MARRGVLSAENEDRYLGWERIRTVWYNRIMRQCGSCQKEKPLTEFNKKGKWYQSRCRDCQKEWYKSYYDKSPKERKRLAENNKRQKQKIKDYVDSVKKDQPCADCGVKYPPYVMDFDHLNDKTMNVAEMRLRRGLESVKEEIKKCELVCANCHRIRTHDRMK